MIPLCSRYLSAKLRAYSRLQAELLHTLYEEAERLAEKIGVIAVEDILSLDVEIYGEPGSDKWLKVRDERINRDIALNHVSSALAAVLMLKHLISALADAQHPKKLVVVEEPEEASAPVQQVLFSRFIERALREEDVGEVYLVITTHSPFIAYSFSNPRLYYFYYDYSITHPGSSG